MDINTKVLKKNAFRVTKERYKTAARIRVPGGHLDAKYLDVIRQTAELYGNGTVHLTTRQGFEIPGIAMDKIAEVNAMLQPIIEGLNISQVSLGSGYPAAGTRNVSACIGSKVCPFGNYDTSAFAQRIEQVIFPNDYHVKIALTGCPNDCIKSRMQDYGIIGMNEPQYDAYRCVGCQSCVTNCKKRAAGALKFENFKVVRDNEKCIGCGECVIKCPTSAWTRSSTKLYQLVIMGRTGKKNPRIAQPFIRWIDEASIIKILKNTYAYIDQFIDKEAPGGKEHVGYIVDRTGYPVFKEWILKDIILNPEAQVAESTNW
ncbi:sulfite reductase subunit C [Sporomusa malonica]|uniref:Anaerobic sulfite reductase subunit C n=1 Tax=Sporomusa malonica TaxID=112901 RepID=A0A1W1YHN0_9FIRM|nr:sulfite reductase subunit C [Sporomusa malonica]SMC35632.1 anaerobic sulfite reductase subunit C [Sporomusa malonica]